jgi:hypothetical protein
MSKREHPHAPAGEPMSIKQAILATGAKLLQTASPLAHFDIYVVGFHCARQDPAMQMEAHHFCRQVNADLLQCVIFDGNTSDANLIGIEYIVSEKLFETLPQQERSYWHPHNFEILSGTLIAPGLPDVAEKAMLRLLMNSYGKTWHTWHTGQHDQPGGDPLPMGDAMLMWSFNREGEMDKRLQHNRDQRMKLDTDAKQRSRQELVDLARPQHGVDTLKTAFAWTATQPIPGVRDVTDSGDDSARES